MNFKELRYRIYGDDKLSGKLDRISVSGRKVDKSLNSASSKMGSLKKKLGSAAAEVPGLNMGLRLMANPLAIAGAGALVLAGGLNKAKNAAIEFRGEFRDLQNLNLDKTADQINALKKSVLQSAYSGGFDASKTSQAYYDVQSVTGKYGPQVGNIVEKVGSFAQVNKADFNKTIAGSAQAMEIYGFHINKVDDYLSSLYKTVLVGKTNFDELSKVQVEYANAAASVGQSYDNANRIFAAFSKTQKNVNIAATMTKTAFEDITKKSTLDGLKQIGVKVFDAEGSMRGVDSILEDLIPKFKNMSDMQFAQFKENIGGSEGIRGLFDMAKNSADKLLQTMKEFDNASYDSLDAFKKALADPNKLSEILNNRMNTSLINLGENLMPMWNKMQMMGIGLVDKTTEAAGNIADMWNFLFDRNKYFADQVNDSVNLSNSRANFSKNKYTDAVGSINNTTKQSEITDLRKQIITDLSAAQIKAESKGSKTLREAYNKQATTLKALLKQIGVNAKLDAPEEEGGAKGSGAQGNNSTVSKGLNGISGGGAKATTITISIGKLNESININTTQLSEATPEIEDKMTETLVRAIAGAEQIMAN